MIKTLKPMLIKPAPVTTPQCCVPVAPPTRATMWRRERYKTLRPSFDPDRCQRESVVSVNGKHYCRIHAGVIALELWLSGDLIENPSKRKKAK